MKVSTLKLEDLTNEIIDKILYEGLEDRGDTGDCIMVLGSDKAQRYSVPKAVSGENVILASPYHALPLARMQLIF